MCVKDEKDGRVSWCCGRGRVGDWESEKKGWGERVR